MDGILYVYGPQYALIFSYFFFFNIFVVSSCCMVLYQTTGVYMHSCQGYVWTDVIYFQITDYLSFPVKDCMFRVCGKYLSLAMYTLLSSYFSAN